MSNEKYEDLKVELLELLEERVRRDKYNKRTLFFPDNGPYRRELYPKQMAFFEAGSRFAQRAAIAGNAVGKTIMGAYETSYHLTGNYPKWWKGARFSHKTRAWCASVTNQATKDILQYELLGPSEEPGTGMVPLECIVKTTSKAGVPNAIETLYVRHSSSTCNCKGSSICSKCEISELTFKAYDQGRRSFQGTTLDFIWLDEEPEDEHVFSECLARTRYRPDEERKIIFCTFTPLSGLSNLVLKFMPGGIFPDRGINPDAPYRFISEITWDDVPHLSEEWKAQTLADFDDYERDARTRGLPSIGSGRIYPFQEVDITYDHFKIEDWFPRCYGLDVGYNRTAAVWLAIDPNTNIIYVYDEYYVGQTVAAIHASAIKQRGEWIAGVIDPASQQRSGNDGLSMLEIYLQEGLILDLAKNPVEAGISKISNLLATGQMKICRQRCPNLLKEFRTYRRDDKGRVAPKQEDHALDAWRYAVMSGLDIACTREEVIRSSQGDISSERTGYNPITGY